jgi:hypothetical protein
MKILIIVLSLVSLSHNSIGQFMGYLTKLNDSKRESVFSEITMVHRSRESPERFLYEIGSTIFMFPKIVNGKELIINHDHFRIVTGYPFINENKVYIQAFLYYDSETIDPRDDEFIIALPFQINKDLMDRELQYYHGENYIDYGFAISKE